MELQIRKYIASDAVGLLNLFYDTVHTINSKDYPPEHIDAWAPLNPDLKKKQSRFKSGKTIVAHLDGKIVGFGNLENDQSSIGMLYVHKDHQGQGIATELLERLEKKTKKEWRNDRPG
ncbi:MAG: GNAT family N-acetyltransferase [Bacteroidota bacterium]